MSDSAVPVPRVAVLSIGNPLRADDGAGAAAMAELSRRMPPDDRVAYIDGSVMGLELTAHVQGVDALLILDAVHAGLAPGGIVRLEGDAIPAGVDPKLSMHQAGLRDLLATLRLMDELPRRVVLLGIEPATIEWSTELSGPVAAAIPELARRAEQELLTFLGSPPT